MQPWRDCDLEAIGTDFLISFERREQLGQLVREFTKFHGALTERLRLDLVGVEIEGL